MARRLCAFRMPGGRPCESPPLHDSQFCLMHSPEHTKEVQEARKLGGMRRKREVAVSGAYDLQGLTTVEGIRRLLEIAVLDTLGMENSIARSRTLAALVQVALRTLEVGNLEERILALEQSVRQQHAAPLPPAFDADPPQLESGKEKADEH